MKIFISYSSNDAKIATTIASALRQAGLEPWIARKEIRPGDSFLARMNEGLAEASYVVLLVSASALASKWVTREWLSALARDEIVLVPVRLDDSELPAVIRDIVYIDLRGDPAAGVKDLVTFFEVETTAPQEPALRSTKARENELQHATRRQLRLVAAKCMDEATLRAFCFDADLDPNRFGGNNLHERLVALLHAADSDGLLQKLACWLELERQQCVSHQISRLQGTPAWEWTAG